MSPITATTLISGYAGLMRANAVQMARAPINQTGAMTDSGPVAASMSLRPDPSLGPRPGPGRGAVIDIQA